MGSIRAPFWACFRSLCQLVFSSENCTHLGSHVGTFFTATGSVEVPYSPLKPIDGRCRRSLSGSLSRTSWGHVRSPKWAILEPLVAPLWGHIYRTQNTSSVLFRPPPLGLLVTSTVGPPNGTCCNHWDFNIDSHQWAKKIR